MLTSIQTLYTCCGIVALMLAAASGSAQAVELTELDQSAQWQQGAFVNGNWVGLATDTTGTWLVLQDSAFFLSATPYEKVFYDGTSVGMTSISRPIQSVLVDLQTKAIDLDSIRNSQFPTGIVDVTTVRSSPDPIYLQEKRVMGASTYHIEPFVVSSNLNFPVLSYVRGNAWRTIDDQATFGIGIASVNNNAFAVERIPQYDTRHSKIPNGFAYAYSTVRNPGSEVSSNQCELRAEPIAVLGTDVGFGLVTEREVLLLDLLGREEGLITIPEIDGRKIRSACTEGSTFWILVEVNGIGTELQQVDSAGALLSTFVKTSPQHDLTRIYHENGNFRIEFRDTNGLQVEKNIVGFERMDVLESALATVSPAVQPYPFPDSILTPFSFGYIDTYPGQHHGPTTVGYTTDGDVYIKMLGTRELRSKSGQFLRTLTTTPTLEQELAPVAWQDKLSVIANDTVVFTSGSTRRVLYATFPDEPAVTYDIGSAIGLPDGNVLISYIERPYRGNSRSYYYFIDTLGTCEGTLQANSLGDKLYPSGLILSGARPFSNQNSSYILNEEGYIVKTYKVIERPSFIPQTFVRCNPSDSLVITDPDTGDEYVFHDIYSNHTVFNDGIGYLIDVLDPPLLVNNIQTLDLSNCPYGEGSGIELEFYDPSVVVSVTIDDIDIIDWISTASNSPVRIEITDTTGCVLTTRRNVIRHELSFDTTIDCLGSTGGEISSIGNVLNLNGETYQDQIDSLASGNYPIQIQSDDLVCSWDTTITIEAGPNLDFYLEQTPEGDSVKLTVIPIDTSVSVNYVRPDVGFIRNNIFYAFPGDTVTVLARHLRGPCRFEQEFVVVNTVGTKGYSSNEIRIFPNPVRESFRIVSEADIQLVKLLDASGRVVLEQAFVGNKEAQILVNQLPAGQYTIEVRASESITHQLLIKE